MSLGHIKFEVHGRVQGVFFRDCTVRQARALRLVGWVANTRRGTVMGVAEGALDGLADMKNWLSCVGSPSSRIDECKILEERAIEQCSFETFDRRSTTS